MISYPEFGALRLSQFRPDAEISELEGWEYEDREWVGEAVGFSEWLRPADTPEVLGSLSLDFGEFPRQAADRVLKAIGLPVRPGMEFEELRAALGEPVETLRFGPAKVTYGFLTPEPHRYKVSCTVKQHGGLSYLDVMIPAE
ncbi:hypothetical protein EP7_005088 [Isosphaeraceae bacterium EP7]